MLLKAAYRCLLLVVLTCGLGCQSTTTDGGGLSLPTFGAPEQWEPNVDAATSDEDGDV